MSKHETGKIGVKTLSGSAPLRSRRRDAEMARQVALQWPGAIPRPRSLDCSATPSDSMKWRPRVDHGQKHETGDRMHFELDDHVPITEGRYSTLIQAVERFSE
jgi:hypothetical protein